MSCACASEAAICPCGQFVHPAVITNLPALDQIAYRVGDYTTFRHALLRALPGETALTRTVNQNVLQIWRPGAEGDLALQMMEWWAYLADILTFYNERAANQAYLRTADLPEIVNRLIRQLGYRPRPGIGATGTLAALMNSPAAFALPKGFQIQSKPGPGQSPQIFESDALINVSSPDTVPVDPPVICGIQLDSSGSVVTATLNGVISGVKTNEKLLLLKNGWTGDDHYVFGSVQSVTTGKTPRGNSFTQISLTTLTSAKAFSDLASATNFRLMKSAQSSQFFQYEPPSSWQKPQSENLINLSGVKIEFLAGSKIGGSQSAQVGPGANFVDLQSIVRQIKPGDAILFDDPTANSPQLVSVQQIRELIYYIPNPSVSGQSVAFPHTQLSFSPALASALSVTSALAFYAWQDIGQLIDLPATQISWTTDAIGQAHAELTAVAPATLPPGNPSQEVFLQDANGAGVDGDIALGDESQAQTSFVTKSAAPPALKTPLSLLLNLFPVSRGKTVSGEVLGSGNAAVDHLDFTLQKSPVTYFQAAAAAAVSGDGFGSTVQVWVNQIEWSEVPTLYGQPADAQVFITKEDDQGQTHVIFGDGLNGAKPPTGAGIVANYRYGSGADAPAAGSLVTILKPLPGLKAILNPFAVGGGANPDPADKIRQLAPRSVLTFGRAVSLDDFTAIAASAPGVTRAQAAMAFDALAQRPRITLWVGDDDHAVSQAQAAISGACDPNNVPNVIRAVQVNIAISATLVIDPTYEKTSVVQAATAALVDADQGLFGVNSVGIGEAIYDSQIYAACTVTGVLAVQDLAFTLLDSAGVAKPIFPLPLRQAIKTISFLRPISRPQCADHRHDPGDGQYFFLEPDNVTLTPA